MSNSKEARLPSNIKSFILTILRIMLGVFVFFSLIGLLFTITKGDLPPIFILVVTLLLFGVYKAISVYL